MKVGDKHLQLVFTSYSIYLSKNKKNITFASLKQWFGLSLVFLTREESPGSVGRSASENRSYWQQ